MQFTSRVRSTKAVQLTISRAGTSQNIFQIKIGPNEVIKQTNPNVSLVKKATEWAVVGSCCSCRSYSLFLGSNTDSRRVERLVTITLFWVCCLSEGLVDMGLQKLHQRWLLFPICSQLQRRHNEAIMKYDNRLAHNSFEGTGR